MSTIPFDPLALPEQPDTEGLLSPEQILMEEMAAEEAARAEIHRQEQERIEKEHVEKLLSDLVDRAYREERPGREIMIRRYKRLNLFWTGNQYAVWDGQINDYRTLDQVSTVLDELQIDPALYNRPVNVFRAWGESIVGALATSVPKVRFAPERPSVAEDISTARAYDDMAELIDTHNDAEAILTKICTILYKHGMVAVHNYTHEDKRYGMAESVVYGTKQVQDISTICPSCGNDIAPVEEGVDAPISPDMSVPSTSSMEETVDAEEGTKDEGNVQDLAPEAQTPEEVLDSICPACGPVKSEQEMGEPYEQTIPVGTEQNPKRRVLFEVYEPLNIIVPQNAAAQKDCGFLICDVEIHEGLAMSLHPKLRMKIKGTGTGADSDETDRWARQSTEYGGDYADYLVTYRRCWFRPWYYECCDTLEDVELLKKHYPRGVRVTKVDTNVAECVEEELDACWTLSYNPLANRIYDYSIGMGAMPIQEMFSEMINLILLTIQYGVPETFADPEYFSFQKYKKMGSSAGLVYPAKRPPGGNLSDVFHSLAAATLPKDTVEFVNRLEQLGQLVTGAFPSIFGGPSAGGSKTFGEYETSRNQALQRLMLLWKMVITLWKDVKMKSCKMFKEAMLEDEYFSRSNGTSDMEVCLKREEMSGKVGRVMSDASENFPISMMQQRDTFMKLIEQQFQPFLALISMPENASYLADVLGLRRLYIPGDADRNKQLREIALLLTGAPIPSFTVDPTTGMETQTFEPSVPIQPEVDNHQIEAEICSVFLRSEVGQYMKDVNPAGFENVLAHKRAHDIIVQQQMMQQQAVLAAQGGEAETATSEPQIQETA